MFWVTFCAMVRPSTLSITASKENVVVLIQFEYAEFSALTSFGYFWQIYLFYCCSIVQNQHSKNTEEIRLNSTLISQKFSLSWVAIHFLLFVATKIRRDGNSLPFRSI